MAETQTSPSPRRRALNRLIYVAAIGPIAVFGGLMVVVAFWANLLFRLPYVAVRYVITGEPFEAVPLRFINRFVVPFDLAHGAINGLRK